MDAKNLSEEEKEEFLKKLRKEKDKHLLAMTLELKKTKNFILVTDNTCNACGKLEDIFLMINKELNYIISQCPDAKPVWVEYFRDIANQLESGDKND